MKARHGLGRLVAAAVCGAMWLASGAATAQTRVSFPSLDGDPGAPIVLTAEWFAARSPGPAPAVVLMHGCGGSVDRHGQLTPRMRRYADLLNRAGLHALVVDSLTPRYEVELCTQRTGKRRVSQVNRRLDALGAIAYLAQRQDVDAARIGLMGWSNGGSSVLAATNQRHHDVASAQVRPAFAIAFYPGCEAELRRGYEPVAPLLILAGELDDWTPAAPCRALARKAGPRVEIEVYAGAHHGFDSAQPIHLRKDVPNGVRPGQGVHVGGQDAAWRASTARWLKFLPDR